MTNAPAHNPRPPAWLHLLAAGNLLVAAAWGHYGWRLFKEVGTHTLERQLSEMIASPAAAGGRAPEPLSSSRVNSPFPTRPRAGATTSTPPPQENALSVLSWQSPPPGPPTFDARGNLVPRIRTSSTLPQPDAAPPGARRRAFDVGMAEAARQGWAALNACLAGVLIAGALGMALARSNGPWVWRSARGALWLALPAAAFGLGMLFADGRNRDWSSPADWLIALIAVSQSPREAAALLLLALAAAAGAGLLGLHRRHGARTWMSLSIAALFVATFATLAAVTVLIRAGLPPLPTWVYAAVALVQSSWGWVLLFAMSGVPGSTARAPARP